MTDDDLARPFPPTEAIGPSRRSTSARGSSRRLAVARPERRHDRTRNRAASRYLLPMDQARLEVKATACAAIEERMMSDTLDHFTGWRESLQADLNGGGQGNVIDNKSVGKDFFEAGYSPADAQIVIESFVGDGAR